MNYGQPQWWAAEKNHGKCDYHGDPGTLGQGSQGSHMASSSSPCYTHDIPLEFMDELELASKILRSNTHDGSV